MSSNVSNDYNEELELKEILRKQKAKEAVYRSREKKRNLMKQKQNEIYELKNNVENIEKEQPHITNKNFELLYQLQKQENEKLLEQHKKIVETLELKFNEKYRNKYSNKIRDLNKQIKDLNNQLEQSNIITHNLNVMLENMRNNENIKPKTLGEAIFKKSNFLK